MYLDAFFSMIIYTFATAAFFILGAAVLHGRGEIPSGYQMIETLSRMYTETIGPGAKYFFLAGAIVVLFSTLFAATAANARQFTDAFGRLKLLKFENRIHRERAIGIVTWTLLIIWFTAYTLVQRPVFMVVLGGIATSIILLLVVYAAFVFRFRDLPKPLTPSKFYDVFLFISSLAIIGVGVKAIISSIELIF
jgi:manganese transport protein